MIHSNKLKTNLKQIKDTIYFQLLEGTQIRVKVIVMTH